MLEKGLVAFRRNHDEQALQYLDELVKLHPKSDYTGLAYLVKGALYDLKGNRKRAVEFYNKARDEKQLGSMKFWLKTHLNTPYQHPQRHILVGNIFDLPDRP